MCDTSQIGSSCLNSNGYLCENTVISHMTTIEMEKDEKKKLIRSRIRINLTFAADQ